MRLRIFSSIKLEVISWTALTAYLVLSCLGLLMVASATVLGKEGLMWTNYVTKQFVGLLLGVFFGFLLCRVNFFNRLALIFLFCLCAGTVFLPVIFGTEVQGAYRWIKIFGINFQPGELSKLFLIAFLSHFFGIYRNGPGIKGPFVVPTVLVSILLLGFYAQRDLGSMAVVGLIYLVALTFVLKNWLPIFGFSFISLTILALSIIAEDYRVQRIKAFLDPFADPLGGGYQIIQALTALKEGGIFGKGLGLGSLKISALPAAHTDFILSVLGEELGIFGYLLALGFLGILCGSFLVRAILLYRIRRDVLLNALVFVILSAHGLTNSLVNLGTIPTKGIPFPLLSYGGSQAFAFSALIIYALFTKWR
ncbi:MAG: FtsW/RodA/SpoVE family cell cycle protein [Deltaproteobacteria bacterium]|nr:FtsW/RodA/SpoVE family cell cycle protein [Deltaproteobacteria bacterium]